MRHGRSTRLAVVVGVLAAPLAALAQPETGSVTTSPLGVQAPALGTPLFIILAVALAALTAYRLQRAHRGRIAGLCVVAAVTALAGLVYAAVPPMITIMGADCTKRTVSIFDPLLEPTKLISDCPHPIQIVNIQTSCGGPEGLLGPEVANGGAANDVPECAVGMILENGELCNLPVCT